MGDYKTSDIYLGAFLRAKGAKLAGVTGRLRKTFVLELEDVDLGELAQAYFNNPAVPILDYLSHVRILRNLCRSGRDDQ